MGPWGGIPKTCYDNLTIVLKVQSGATTFSLTTFSITTLSITTLSITTFSITTLSIRTNKE